jgi:hypothetical protein
LTAALRAHAAGLLCARAAVELLIGRAVWLRRSGFVDRFMTVETDPGLVGQTALAWVGWHGAAGAAEAGRLPCSASEGHILLIAPSVAEGVAVELGDAVTGLDAVDSVLVARSVLAASGHREAAEALAGVAGR